MAVSSLSNFCLSPHRYMNSTPKFPHPTIKNPIKTHILNLPSSLFLHPKHRQPVGKIHIQSRPISNPSILAFLSPPRKKISTFFVQKIATLLLGSLIFIGCLKSRPVLAQPVQESESVEEEIDAQNSGNEDEEMCEKLLQENPKNIDALKMVVNVKMRRGKTDEGVKYVEKLIELQPNEMEWRLLQAHCYEMMGNLSKAKSLFKIILKQKPLLLRALHGNMEEALTKFQALIDENPRDFRPYLCQGIVYSLLEEKQEAEKNFEIYRSLVPEEFPQRGFLDDVVLAAKTETKQQLEKELQQ
ncbi:hypothetical protein ACS0TY_029838 [Phlomoides rotata]